MSEDECLNEDLSSQIPETRSVAQKGIVNLGNTCYANAVLQALAHAPELCYAMERTPRHSVNCTAEFCVLCEVEHLVARLHSPPQSQSQSQSTAPTSVSPKGFINGFTTNVAPWFQKGRQEDSHEFLRMLIDGMQKSFNGADKINPQNHSSPMQVQGYPHELFCGKMESVVICGHCQASNTTTDPMEDLGLDIANESNSVIASLDRFVQTESVDGYKCDKCHATGNTTKSTKLAQLPPILTLHLKRFRYGSAGEGRSGSSKIEGHVKFDQFFDLRPYITNECFQSLQQPNTKPKNMFCRLFALIVHAGANSHSGHYYAYVRNLAKNEWWKMDDSTRTQVTLSEVMSAQAYMLFYRVVDHPMSLTIKQHVHSQRRIQRQEYQAKKQAQAQEAQQKLIQHQVKEDKTPQQQPEEKEKRELDTQQNQDQDHPLKLEQSLPDLHPDLNVKPISVLIPTPEINPSPQPRDIQPSPQPPTPQPPTPRSSTPTQSTPQQTQQPSQADPPEPPKITGHKRPRPKFRSGEEWARKRTRLTPQYAQTLFRQVQLWISEHVEFKPEYLSLLQQLAQSHRGIGNAPPCGVSQDDLKGGGSRLKSVICSLLHRVVMDTTSSNNGMGFWLNEQDYQMHKRSRTPETPKSSQDCTYEQDAITTVKPHTPTPPPSKALSTAASMATVQLIEANDDYLL